MKLISWNSSSRLPILVCQTGEISVKRAELVQASFTQSHAHIHTVFIYACALWTYLNTNGFREVRSIYPPSNW